MWPLRSVVVGAAGLLRDADPSQGLQLLSGNTEFLDEDLRRALADELLFGKLMSGGRVTVDVDAEDKVQLTFDETPAPRNPNPEAVEVE